MQRLCFRHSTREASVQKNKEGDARVSELHSTAAVRGLNEVAFAAASRVHLHFDHGLLHSESLQRPLYLAPIFYNAKRWRCNSTSCQEFFGLIFVSIQDMP